MARAEDPRGGRSLQKVQGQPRTAAPRICYRSPSLCPKIPAQKPGGSGLSLWKSGDRPEPSELTGGEQLRARAAVPSLRSQSPLDAFEETPFSFTLPLITNEPFLKHEPALPWAERLPLTAAALGQRRASHAGRGPRGWDGASGETGVPLFPCLQIAAAPPQTRCQARGARGLMPHP